MSEAPTPDMTRLVITVSLSASTWRCGGVTSCSLNSCCVSAWCVLIGGVSTQGRVASSATEALRTRGAQSAGATTR